MKKNIFRVFLAINLALFVLVLVCGSGCANVGFTDFSVTLKSNRTTSPIHTIRRLLVIINPGSLEPAPTSNTTWLQMRADILVASLQHDFSNTTAQVEICIVNPVELDDTIYRRKINEFHADAVLDIIVKRFIENHYGGLETIFFDATVHDEIIKKRVWWAAIDNGGATNDMEQRMTIMSKKIVAQLQADGLVESR